MDERFSLPAQAQAFLCVHVVKVKFYFSSLPVDTVHVFGFGSDDAGVLELNSIAQVNTDATADLSTSTRC